MEKAAPFVRLIRAAALEERLAGEGPWSLASLAGRLAELSGPGSLTLACRIVRDAQQAGEPACWIATGPAIFFPPDMAANGVAIEALPVVRVPDALWAARAADRLLRSGAFGLIVVDLEASGRGGTPVRLSGGARLVRLAQLALRHDTALLCLGAGAPLGGAGSMVSLRARSRRRRLPGSRYCCELAPLKDKRRGTGWRGEEICHGPPGLR